jgi:hypothetical protein
MLLSEQAMARKIDWERRNLSNKSRYGLSIKDEAEFRQKDLAARWLKSAEAQRDSSVVAECKPKPKPSKAKPTPIKYYKTFAEIPTDDPHAQLVGVDMSRPPW